MSLGGAREHGWGRSRERPHRGRLVPASIGVQRLATQLTPVTRLVQSSHGAGTVAGRPTTDMGRTSLRSATSAMSWSRRKALPYMFNNG